MSAMIAQPRVNPIECRNNHHCGEQRRRRNWSFLWPVVLSVLLLTTPAGLRGQSTTNASDTHAERFAALDADGDGRVTEGEFFGEFDRDAKPLSGQAYRTADIDGDNVLSPDEFSTALFILGEQDVIDDPWISRVESVMQAVREQWQEVDADDNELLNEREFASLDGAVWNSAAGGLTFAACDGDSNGAVSLEELQRGLEVSFGVRRPQGELTRTDQGIVISWMHFKHFDNDQSNGITEEEFVERGFGDPGLRSEEFRNLDLDESGVVDFGEWSNTEHPEVFPARLTRPIAEFLHLDADGNGRVDEAELMSGTPDWQRKLAEFVFPGFDIDGDALLNLTEFRLTMLANWIEFWQYERSDVNDDGLLSRAEFDWGRGSSLASLLDEYFQTLDVNGDDRLDLDEYFFRTNRRDPRHEFAQRDQNADDVLDRDEFMALPAGDAAAWGRDFALVDFNRDGVLSFDEFRDLPSVIPEDLRGDIPDPIVELVAQRLEECRDKWSDWDADGNGSIDAKEFTAANPGNSVPGLDRLTFAEWDRDGDSRIGREELRLVLEIAYGVRRPQGELIREPDGRIINWMAFKHLDTNSDDRLDHDECVVHGFDGDQAEARFRNADQDGDEYISFAEWAVAPYRSVRALDSFRHFDANYDGSIDRDELLTRTASWQMRISAYLFPGFDRDEDGTLSLAEYQFTPLVNLQQKWHEPRTDQDEDGRLSPEEFRWEAGIDAAALTAEYFSRLDVDDNGWIEQGEFFFHTTRIDPQIAFREFDTNGDSSVVLAEFEALYPGRADVARRDFGLFDQDQDTKLTKEEFCAVSPYIPARERRNLPDPLVGLVEAQLQRIETRWGTWDSNGDGFLDRSEFRSQGVTREIEALELTVWDEWDLDGDGRLTRDEARRVLEVSYGVRHPNGDRLRTTGGVVFNWMLFQHFDDDRDGRISSKEFVDRGFGDPEQRPADFAALDSDGSRDVSFEEWTDLSQSLVYPARYAEPVVMFQKLDSDLNGRVTEEELLAGTEDWKMSVARFVFPGFDVDHSGDLDLDEYRLTPLANWQVFWQHPRYDGDFDGLLGRSEFVWTELPTATSLAGYLNYCFDRLDVDGSGALELDEFGFNLDSVQAPREDVFAWKDADGDGLLSFEEASSGVQPPGGNKNDVGYQTRLSQSEDAFQQADTNGDNMLDPHEFQADIAITAVAPNGRLSTGNLSSVFASRNISAEGTDSQTWFVAILIIAVLNVLLAGSVAVCLFRRSRVPNSRG